MGNGSKLPTTRTRGSFDWHGSEGEMGGGKGNNSPAVLEPWRMRLLDAWSRDRDEAGNAGKVRLCV